MKHHTLPPSARLKVDLMSEGVRYSEALGEAGKQALPNYNPYRFQPGEDNPTGKATARIPYLFVTEDGTLVRVKGNSASSWVVNGSADDGFRIGRDGEDGLAVRFEPLPAWMTRHTSDGTPMVRCGVSQHGDMLIVNLAPGCQYFLAERQDGVSMRCTFCTYGAPDARLDALGQEMARVALPEASYTRVRETLAAAIEEREIRHIYLVGGSMTDWRQEGERFIEIARRVQEVIQGRIPLACGSGALPEEALRRLHDENLVQNVCFNLEVWSQPLFAKVCPGKHRYVGYERWIGALETAVGLWGRERVYSAMVAGVELEPEHNMSWQEAAGIALEGADDLCSRGIIPIYSLYWPLGGGDRKDYMSNVLSYFERLNLGYRELREHYDLRMWDGFVCHRCAYMQLECDVDRALDVQDA